MYCMKCGRELQEGVPCVCTQEQNVGQQFMNEDVNYQASQQVVNENVEPQVEQQFVNENMNYQASQQFANENVNPQAGQQFVNENMNFQTSQPNKDKKISFDNLLKNFGLIFINPLKAIKDAISNKRWVNGLIYILIFSLISGVTSVVSYAWNELEYYNSQIQYAKEDYKEAEEEYEEAKANYLLNDSYYNERSVGWAESALETAEGRLETAKENRMERLTSFSFITGVIVQFVKEFITPILTVLIIALLLLAVGKIFKGNGTFTQALAGVGLSYNIKYLSAMVLPLLAKIPLIGWIFSAASSGITAIFGVYIYLVAKETFEIDENRTTLAVFLGVWIAALISRIVWAI